MTAMKELEIEMKLTATEPKFFVVIVLDPGAEDFSIGAIWFSLPPLRNSCSRTQS